MTERDGPVLGRDQAPDHGPNFWQDFEASLTNAASVHGPDTAELSTVTALHDRPSQARRLWPMAAAAAVLAVVGLGLLALQRADGPSTTAEVVAGSTDAEQVVPLDGPDGDDGEANSDQASSPSPATEAGADVVPTPEADQAGSVVSATPTPAPPREFEAAFGAEGTAAYLPFDDSLSPNATFLANWPDRALSWYAEVDPQLNCVDQGVGTISYVNGSGLVQDVRDPQLRFSGDISHFTVHPDENLAAWIVACGSQLELYAATLDDTGQIEHLNLVWLGQGSPRAALIVWDETEVNLNAIDPGGTPFAIGYDTESDELTRNDGPSSDALEEGSPVWRDATPLVATPDGGVSYWVGEAPADIFSACIETVGSDETETLWLRYGDGTWLPAIADATPVGRITAAAIEPTFSQIAFADVCDGQTQRLFLGTQRADGRVSNLREISLTPYVPGFASELFWVDAQTLRIEIDNSAFGAEPNRLDFRLDDGRQASVIVQLD